MRLQGKKVFSGLELDPYLSFIVAQFDKLTSIESGFPRIEMDKVLMKLSTPSMTYMHGVDSFLN